MAVRRRQFLILGGGALGGLALSSLAPQLHTRGDRRLTHLEGSINTGFDQISTVASPTPVAQNSIAPGLFIPPRGDVRLVAISDLNSQYGSTDYEPEVDKAIALLPTWRPDMVLCSGDMVAGQDEMLPRERIRAMWEAFDRHVAAPLRQMSIPYGFTVGNHDASAALASDGGFLFSRDREAAATYWRDPRHNPGVEFVDRAGFPFYYTFQQKGIFYLVWDASTARVPQEQVAWADRSLASPVAQAANLRIVIGHLPLYAVAVGRSDAGEFLFDAESLQAMLERHRVHTYISGHHHAYYPAHKDNLQLLHCGILGSGMRPLLAGALVPQKTLTVIDVSLAAADTRYTTYDMQTMQLVDQSKLPKFIAGPNGKILRRDIEWNDLSPEEQATEFIPDF